MDWKTTTAGVIGAVVIVLQQAAHYFTGQPVDYSAIVLAITTAVGLFHATDAKK